MDLIAYEKLVLSESRARRWLLGFCFENHQRFCPRCRHRKLYRLKDGRRRCSECQYTFHDFSGRWVNHGDLSCQNWLRLLKLFELELSTKKIAYQLNLSYKTAWKAIMTVRYAILADLDPDLLFSGEVELDEAYFGGKRKGHRGRGAANKIPVFGILERKGKVSVSVVPNVSAQTLLDQTTRVVKRGALVYTDKFRSYDTLTFCGYRHLKIDHGRRFSSGKVHINGLEGFWSFAKERLIKHHGISPQYFPLYLKELEFRYNNRHNNNLYANLTKCICNLVPNRT